MDAITRAFKIINGLHLYPNRKEKTISTQGGLTFSRSKRDIDMKESVVKGQIRSVKRILHLRSKVRWIIQNNLQRICFRLCPLFLTLQQKILSQHLFLPMTEQISLGRRETESRRVTLATSAIQNIHNSRINNEAQNKSVIYWRARKATKHKYAMLKTETARYRRGKFSPNY